MARKRKENCERERAYAYAHKRAMGNRCVKSILYKHSAGSHVCICVCGFHKFTCIVMYMHKLV
jgi:hypothetical protein